MLTAEPVDLRGRRALAKSLEKEERHATAQLKQALKASNAAVDELVRRIMRQVCTAMCNRYMQPLYT